MCPHATDAEIDMLLDTVNTVLARPLDALRRGRDVRGPSPAADDAPRSDAADGETSDLSRRHAILESSTGVLSVVGGKLTTYRRMAQDGVDAAVARRFARGRGARHPSRAIAAARGRVAPRTLGRDRGAAAARAPLRRRGAVRRDAAGRPGRRARGHGAGAALGRAWSRAR